jgi:hypothetical protein
MVEVINIFRNGHPYNGPKFPNESVIILGGKVKSKKRSAIDEEYWPFQFTGELYICWYEKEKNQMIEKIYTMISNSDSQVFIQKKIFLSYYPRSSTI